MSKVKLIFIELPPQDWRLDKILAKQGRKACELYFSGERMYCIRKLFSKETRRKEIHKANPVLGSDLAAVTSSARVLFAWFEKSKEAYDAFRA